MQTLLATVPKNRFPATFVGHIVFLCKMQKHVYLGNGARFLQKSTGDFTETVFPATFGGHLEFRQNF